MNATKEGHRPHAAERNVQWFPENEATKAATVTLKLSRSCGLRSRNWMRSRFQAFEVRAIPTSRCNNNVTQPL
jgi:hypothetical protein